MNKNRIQLDACQEIFLLDLHINKFHIIYTGEYKHIYIFKMRCVVTEAGIKGREE